MNTPVPALQRPVRDCRRALRHVSTGARPTPATIDDVYKTRSDCDDGGIVVASAYAAQWRISLLGGVRITDASGEQVDPGPAKCQELLAALALEPQVAITVGRLVGLLWGESHAENG